MNDRIKELITQAGTDCSGKWIGISNAEKLAELIVKECADIALREDHDPYECIKSHFGVK